MLPALLLDSTNIPFTPYACILIFLYLQCEPPDMAWRNQGITGSNNIPLGARRRFGGGDSAPPADDGGYNPSQPSAAFADGGFKRGRSPERGMFQYDHSVKVYPNSFSVEPVDGGEKRRKKRNRWGDAAENKAAGLMGLPTMIKANMTNEQLEAYTLHLRIQEISEKLRINDVVPADGDRYVLYPLTFLHSYL